jgi:hypothetical protein
MPVRAGEQRVLEFGVREERAQTCLRAVDPVKVGVELQTQFCGLSDVPRLLRLRYDPAEPLDRLLDGHTVAKVHGLQSSHLESL